MILNVKAILFTLLLAFKTGYGDDPRSCDDARSFYVVNGSSTVSFPAIELFNDTIRRNPNKQWHLTRTATPHRTLSHGQLFGYIFVDTADGNTTGLDLCAQTVYPTGLREYNFRPEVLSRSVDDTGDCKVMLGERCIEALKKTMQTAFDCQSIFDRVPDECASISFSNKWDTSSSHTNFSSKSAPNNNTLSGTCDPPVQALSKSQTLFYAQAMNYTDAIRAPSVTILIASHLEPRKHPKWDDSTHGIHESLFAQVEVVCARSDDIITPGSLVPPKMDEVMKWPNVTFKNSTFKPDVNTASATAGGKGFLVTVGILVVMALFM